MRPETTWFSTPSTSSTLRAQHRGIPPVSPRLRFPWTTSPRAVWGTSPFATTSRACSPIGCGAAVGLIGRLGWLKQKCIFLWKTSWNICDIFIYIYIYLFIGFNDFTFQTCSKIFQSDGRLRSLIICCHAISRSSSYSFLWGIVHFGRFNAKPTLPHGLFHRLL